MTNGENVSPANQTIGDWLRAIPSLSPVYHTLGGTTTYSPASPPPSYDQLMQLQHIDMFPNAATAMSFPSAPTPTPMPSTPSSLSASPMPLLSSAGENLVLLALDRIIQLLSSILAVLQHHWTNWPQHGRGGPDWWHWSSSISSSSSTQDIFLFLWLFNMNDYD